MGERIALIATSYMLLLDLLGLFLLIFMLFPCRRNLPVDLAEGVLRALCLQALGQVRAFSLNLDEMLGCLY